MSRSVMMQCEYDPEPRPYSQWELVLDRLTKQHADAREDWMATEISKHLEPDVFIRAYGNAKCKKEVATILEAKGFELHYCPDGRDELWVNGKLLSKYEQA